MRNGVELNKKFFELGSKNKFIISALEITSGILAALAVFVILFGICTKNYSYQTSMEICYYSLLILTACLPVYLITTLLKIRSLHKEFHKLIYLTKHIAVYLFFGWLICCGIFYFFAG